MRKRFEEDLQTESRLRALPLRPVPDGLRERIVGAARAERSSRAWTTPLLRWALAGTAFALAAAVLISAVSDRIQTARLRALMDGRPAVPSETERDWILNANDLGDMLGPTEITREKLMMAYRRPETARTAVRFDKNSELEDIDGQGISEDPD